MTMCTTHDAMRCDDDMQHAAARRGTGLSASLSRAHARGIGKRLRASGGDLERSYVCTRYHVLFTSLRYTAYDTIRCCCACAPVLFFFFFFFAFSVALRLVPALVPVFCSFAFSFSFGGVWEYGRPRLLCSGLWSRRSFLPGLSLTTSRVDALPRSSPFPTAPSNSPLLLPFFPRLREREASVKRA